MLPPPLTHAPPHPDKSAPTMAEVAGQVVDAPLDLFEQVGDVFIIKWQAATQQCIQDDTTAPHINLRTRIQLATDHLRGTHRGSAVQCRAVQSTRLRFSITRHTAHTTIASPVTLLSSTWGRGSERGSVLSRQLCIHSSALSLSHSPPPPRSPSHLWCTTHSTTQCPPNKTAAPCPSPTPTPPLVPRSWGCRRRS